MTKPKPISMLVRVAAFSLALLGVMGQVAAQVEAEAEDDVTQPSAPLAAAPRLAADAESPTPPPIQIEPREVPDFDGRGDDPTTAGEALLWIPRVVLAPLYFVTEYVLRRPLAWLVTRAEQKRWHAKMVEFFHFGPDQRFVLAPSFAFETGFRPSVGLHFAVEDAIVDGNYFYTTVGFGGKSWLSASAGDRYSVGAWETGLRGNFSMRPDGRFYGIGSEISENASSYDWTGISGELYLRRAVSQQGFIALGTGVRYREFGNDVGGRESVQDAVDQGRFSALPPGFAEGFTAQYIALSVDLDSRPARPQSQTGGKLMLRVESGIDLRQGATGRSWIKYAGSVSGYWDVSSVNHVLGLTLGAGVIDELHGDVPFTELLSLSGTGPMSGFITGFLLGESELVATLSYDWPIWMWLTGTAHFAVGNTYDGTFNDFAFDGLHMSTGVGIAAVGQRDHFFELLVGFGTDTFANGADIESVRVSFGARREF